MIDRSVEQARLSHVQFKQRLTYTDEIAVAATFIAALTLSPFAVAQGHEHGSDTALRKK